MRLDPYIFLKETNGFAPERARRFKLAKVDTNYTSGRPAVVFDGESVVTTKEFPYLDSYTPAADDRVLLARVGTTWVILGKIS